MLLTAGGKAPLPLRHAIRPEDADDVGVGGLAEAKFDGKARLAEAGLLSAFLEAGPKRSGLNRDPSSDAVGIGAFGQVFLCAPATGDVELDLVIAIARG